MQRVMYCDAEQEYFSSSPALFDIPEFIFVDQSKNELRGTRLTGKLVTKEIKHSEQFTENSIYQGQKAGKAWSLNIENNYGRLVLTVIDKYSSYSGFGICKLQGQNKK
ncbi:MAG: hypothetical protein V7776_12440 [Halopseudomonas aestusnigri]